MHIFLVLDIIVQIGGRLFTSQPFSTGRFELEENRPMSQRFRGTFKFPIVPKIAEIMGIFKFLNTTFLYGPIRVRGKYDFLALE